MDLHEFDADYSGVGYGPLARVAVGDTHAADGLVLKSLCVKKNRTGFGFNFPKPVSENLPAESSWPMRGTMSMRSTGTT